LALKKIAEKVGKFLENGVFWQYLAPSGNTVMQSSIQPPKI